MLENINIQKVLTIKEKISQSDYKVKTSVS